MKILTIFLLIIIQYGFLPVVQSRRFVEVGERVHLGCPQAFLYNNWLLYDEVTSEPETIMYYDYENENYVVKYPQEHETSVWPGGGRSDLIITSAKVSDTGLWSCENAGFENIHDLSVNANDNSDLVNKVIVYGRILRLAYYKELSDEGIVQWTLVTQDGTVQNFYYGKQSTGGLLEPYTDRFEESDVGHGVQTAQLGITPYIAGSYRYIVRDGSEVEYGEFSVTGTVGIMCDKTEYFIKDRQQTHNCSAVVSVGNLVPVFTLLKDGVPMQGETIMDPTPFVAGRLWKFVHHFVPDFDDVNVSFTCHLTFRYEGPASVNADTSDPDFEKSCTVQYDEIEYPVSNHRTVPDSDNPNNRAIVRVGDILYCDAEGFPNLTVYWICPDRIDLKDIVVTRPIFENNLGLCTCHAYLTMSDHTFSRSYKHVYLIPAHGSGIITPMEDKTVVVGVGERLTLDCTMAPYINTTGPEQNWEIQWTSALDDGSRHLVYVQGAVLENWKEDLEEGETKHDLVIKQARFDLAGTYQCEAIKFPEYWDIWETQVVVAAPVQCIVREKETKNGDDVDLVCQMEYGGSIEPEIMWYADDTIISSQGSAKVQRTKTSSVKEVSITVKVNPDVHYSCRVSVSSGENQIVSDQCEAFIHF